MKILFVCSGNICRSPMAAEYMRSRAARSGLSHVVVDSAGTLGIDNACASGEAIAVMRENGLDIADHLSRGLKKNDVRTSELVIVMGDRHLDIVDRMNRGRGAEIYLIRAFEHGPEPEPGSPELDDPIGRDIEFYRKQYETIRACVDHLVMYLRHRD
jgi:protein-tyrosine-phosphatase